LLYIEFFDTFLTLRYWKTDFLIRGGNVQTYFQVIKIIQNRGGRLWISVQVIPSNDLIQQRPATLRVANGKAGNIFIPAGTLWRANHTRAKETAGASTHARYDDLYDLLRSGRHAVCQYAVHDSDGAGEMREVREDIETARAFVRFMLVSGMYEPDEKRELLEMQSLLVSRYEIKRARHKTVARSQFMRGMITTDSIGRNNPPAAAMVSGAGIGHLLKRLTDIPRLSTCMDRRTIQVYVFIQSHMNLYRELWDDVRVDTKSRSRGILQQWIIRVSMSESRTKKAFLRKIRRRLCEYREAFTEIRTRPFCKNAAHTVKDLNAAIETCKVGDLRILRIQCAKLRRGIRWVFVLDVLQIEVISRLSFLLARLRREETKRRRSIPCNKREKTIQITRDMAPVEFAAVERLLASFLHRLDRCSDATLDVPVKAKVECLIRGAEYAMTVDDWTLAKKRLISAAKFL